MNWTILTALLIISNCASAMEWSDSRKIAKLFAEAEVSGTFVLYDVAAGKLIGFNQPRAQTRFIPASTFKIPHTLIGVSVGAVKDVDEVLPYGGEPQPFPSWEKNMSLRDAIPISNVPIYRELAKRVGLERMSHHVGLIEYGNGEIGEAVDSFWLSGPLKISAVEQAKFLAKLAQHELPYPREVQNQVQEVVLLESHKGWSLYGKTGWTETPDPDIGWWVGWVSKQGKIYSFALNIDVLNNADAKKRVQLGRDSLRVLGAL